VPNERRPGKTRPEKLSVFRFTSRDEVALAEVARLYGGVPRRWEGAPVDDQWEVITEAKEIGVIVPPGPQSVSQWMELWSGGGCQRRCDGEVEQLRNVPCLCKDAPDADICKATTRVSLVLPDVPGLGVWRLESHGWNAAHELGGTAELLATVRTAGDYVPALLRLEQREKVVNGKTHRFAVPVLTWQTTVRAMLEGPRTGGLVLPPPPPRAVAAIAAAPASADRSPRTSPRTAPPATGQQAAGEPTELPWPPKAPQDLVPHIMASTDLQGLGHLARSATQARWMDEYVDTRFVEESITLGDAFGYREAELRDLGGRS
jgi:hypothetical protein